MQNAAFISMGMNRVYVALEVIDIEQGINGLRSLGVKGASVTVPHKEKALAFVDAIDPLAAQIGAINTLVIQYDSEGRSHIRGYNTDWLGSNTALAAAGVNLQQSRVLVAGSGGSAKAVAFGLLLAGAEVVITNRTAETGQALATALKCEFIPLEDIAWIKADVLINATSVGMEPDVEGMIVPTSVLPEFSVVMDIVYAPLRTRLLREAEAAGCRTIDGLAMLLHQGAEQFQLWTGKTAPQLVMRSALEEELRRKG
jgi:shikimate dehydrogenase